MRKFIFSKVAGFQPGLTGLFTGFEPNFTINRHFHMYFSRILAANATWQLSVQLFLRIPFAFRTSPMAAFVFCYKMNPFISFFKDFQHFLGFAKVCKQLRLDLQKIKPLLRLKVATISNFANLIIFMRTLCCY